MDGRTLGSGAAGDHALASGSKTAAEDMASLWMHHPAHPPATRIWV